MANRSAVLGGQAAAASEGGIPSFPPLSGWLNKNRTSEPDFPWRLQMKDTLWLVWSVSSVAALLIADSVQTSIAWVSPLWVLMAFLAVGAGLFWRMVQRW
jgi:hypothetical protein